MVHVHVLVFGEYVPQWQLQAAWGTALGVAAPVVDVRRITGPDGVAGALREVLKYATKGERGTRTQPTHAAAVELAFRRVRRVELGGALRGVKLPDSNGDSEDVKPEDLHNDQAAACEVCGTVGEWAWLGIVSATVVQMNAGFGVARDYVPPREIRPKCMI
jgi:hypothetical protein